jgi:hypothetical protein
LNATQENLGIVIAAYYDCAPGVNWEIDPKSHKTIKMNQRSIPPSLGPVSVSSAYRRDRDIIWNPS